MHTKTKKYPRVGFVRLLNRLNLAQSINYKMQADFNGELYGRIGRVGDFVAVPGLLDAIKNASN